MTGSHPITSGDAHVYPPVELLQESESTRSSWMAERVGGICDHNPRSHDHGHVNADGLIVLETSSTPPSVSRIVGSCFGELSREQTNAIVGSDDAPFVGDLPNFIERRL